MGERVLVRVPTRTVATTEDPDSGHNTTARAHAYGRGRTQEIQREIELDSTDRMDLDNQRLLGVIVR